jgi:hypothetical protein
VPIENTGNCEAIAAAETLLPPDDGRPRAIGSENRELDRDEVQLWRSIASIRSPVESATINRNTTAAWQHQTGVVT